MKINFKENKGIGLAGFVITILLVLLIVAAMYIVYLIQNPKVEYVAKQEANQTQQTSVAALETTNKGKTESTSVDTFSKYSKQLSENIKDFGKLGETFDGKRFEPYFPTNYDLADDNSNGIEKIIIEYDGTAYVVTKSDKLKIGENIINAGALYCWQDSSVFIYTINKFGELNYCLLDQTTKPEKTTLKFKTLTDMKNVINVMPYNNGESRCILAIDINGNIKDITPKES